MEGYQTAVQDKTPYLLTAIAEAMQDKKPRISLDLPKNLWNDFITPMLCKAVQTGNLVEVRMLVNTHGFSFSRNLRGGYGLLKVAIGFGYVEIAKLLLQKGVQVDLLYTKGYGLDPVLHLATENGYLELVEMILNRGARLHAWNSMNETALHIATRKGDKNMVQLLLNKGASSILRDGNGMEPLLIAYKNGFVEIVEILLCHRAQQKQALHQSLNIALLVASKYGMEDIIKSLLNSGADPGVIIEPPDNLEGFGELIGSSPLHLACENCYESIIELFLKRKTQINCTRLQDGYTPLHIASQNACLEIVNCLLKKGANPDRKADENITPLHLAAENGSLQVVKALLNNGANVNAQTCKGFTSLHLASKNDLVETVHFLLDKGADANLETDNNLTPLHVAAENGCLKIVELLLNNAASINAQTEKGWTPLLLAVKHERLEVVHLLLSEGACINIKDERNETPLSVAIAKKSQSLINCILQYKPDIDDKIKKLIFHNMSKKVACHSIVDYLIEYGFTIDQKDVNNCNILPAAVEGGYLKVVLNFLISGADPNDKRYTESLLNIAVRKRNKEMIKLLLKSGCDINAKDKWGKTPIFCSYSEMICGQEIENQDIFLLLVANGAAVQEASTFLSRSVDCECFEVCKLLIENGADVNKPNEYGFTPLHTAVSGRGSKVLDPAEVKAERKVGETVRGKIVKLLLNNGADLNVRTDEDDLTALHLAASDGNVEAACLLLDFGASVNACTYLGEMPLHLACMNGHAQIVEILLNNKANTEAFKIDHMTPLHVAANEGHAEIVKILLKYDTDIEGKGDGWETALFEAAKNGHREVVEILLENHCNVNAENVFRQTSLMCVISNNKPFFCEFLNERHCLDIQEFYYGLNWPYDRRDYENDCNPNINLVIQTLKKHIIKLDVAGLHVSKRNRDVVFSSNSLETSLSRFQKKCKIEVSRMTEKKYCDQLTLHDLLVNFRNPAYVKHASLSTSFIYKNFPIYGNLLVNGFNESKRTDELLTLAPKWFDTLVKTANVFSDRKLPILPVELLAKIVSYLNKNDLKNLISFGECLKHQFCK